MLLKGIILERGEEQEQRHAKKFKAFEAAEAASAALGDGGTKSLYKECLSLVDCHAAVIMARLGAASGTAEAHRVAVKTKKKKKQVFRKHIHFYVS